MPKCRSSQRSRRRPASSPSEASAIVVLLEPAAQGFELRRPLLSGPKLEAEYAKVRKLSPPLVEDRSQAAEFEAVAEAIRQGVFG